MGKYMRKTKTTDEVAVMESPLGVRTRARTLALQQQQPSSSSCYLQLRSRRLEKPPPPTKMGPTSSVCPAVSEVEVSFGENFLELESRERNSRETTPCSMIRGSETVRTPSSTTRTNSTTINLRRRDSACRNIPTASEMEEFFAHAERIQQRIFVEKYNFDPVNECPLAGRYEWVKLGC